MVKPNKLASQLRLKAIRVAKPEPQSKGHDSRKVHDTKGKNNHGRRY
jgi:hypothetical protein